jgi:predicted secreted hydrolase
MKPIKFPRDEQNHQCSIEWWYWNGHLQDEKGNRYAFMDCLFQVNPKKAKIPLLQIPLERFYFSHSILSDIKKQKFYPHVDYASWLSSDSFKRPLLFVNYVDPSFFNGYTVSVMEKTAPSQYHIKTANFDLRLISQKKPLLEGENGYVDIGRHSTYYYSLTALKTSGTIRIGKKEIAVTGLSWMDHQWSNTVYVNDEWNWFSIQLKNNIEIICFEYRGEENKTSLASISYADARTENFFDVRFTPLSEEWISPRTRARYPLSWRIEIPEKKIDLIVKPLLKKQEVIFGTINYWEGPFKVAGTMAGKKVTGQGFLELVGRASKYKAGKFFREAFEQALKSIKNRK